MMKSRFMKENIDGCRSFVDFTILNCKTLDGLIVCLCKTRCLNRQHLPGFVLDHLTRGKGIWPQYKD
jgi:hypothetical protein